MTVKDVFAQTRDLPARDKAKLVDMILGDLDRPDPIVEKIWIKEVQQRKSNLRSGRTRPLSYRQVMGKYK
jgi:hypothetical protein